MRGFHKNKPDEVSDYDQPTEPLAAIYEMTPSPIAPQVAGGTYPGDRTVPIPPPSRQPMPQQATPPPYPYVSHGSYPPTPIMQGYYPAGMMAPMQPAAPVQPAPAVQTKREHKSPFPAFIGFLFVLVQLLLLARFVLKVINLSAGIPGIEIIYTISDLFIWPVQMLMQQISVPFTLYAEMYTLVAILLYGILSRIIVRLLKAIMDT